MLLTTICTTCGQPVECSNAPHSFCANSHTHKAGPESSLLLLNTIGRVHPPMEKEPDGGLVGEIAGLSRPHGRPQQGRWWGAVDAAIDHQQEAQLLEVNQQLSLPFQQTPLFPPTCPLPKTPTTP